MPRLTKGARELIDQLLADLVDNEAASKDLALQAIEIFTNLPLKVIRFNPEYASQQLIILSQFMAEAHLVQSAARDRMRRRILQDLEPMLQRQEDKATMAALPDQVTALRAEIAALTQRLADLEERTPPLRVIPRQRSSES